MNPKRDSRRRSALARLIKQLETGRKNTKDGSVQLSDKDIIRINKEIQTLSTSG